MLEVKVGSSLFFDISLGTAGNVAHASQRVLSTTQRPQSECTFLRYELTCQRHFLLVAPLVVRLSANATPFLRQLVRVRPDVSNSTRWMLTVWPVGL
jgi:hypothetical protein